MKPIKITSRQFQILSFLCVLLTAAAGAFAQTWTGATGNNNWATTGNWNPVGTPTAPTFGAAITAGSTTLNNNLAANTSLAGLTFSAGALPFTLSGNAIDTTAAISDYSTSTETINLGIVLLNAGQNLYAPTGGKLVIGGVIDDGGLGYGITTTGPGTVSLTASNTFGSSTAATVAVNNGTLELDFNALAIASGQTDSNNIIEPDSILSLGGGTLLMNSSGSLTNTQSFASTTFAAGNSVVEVPAPASGTITMTNNMNLGALTYTAGATVMFVGPATSTGASSFTSNSPTQIIVGQTGAYGFTNADGTQNTTGYFPGTAIITTTSGTVNDQLTGQYVGPSTGTADYAAFATVGLYDFAIVQSGPNGNIIVGASQGTTQSGTTLGNQVNGTDGAYTFTAPRMLGTATGSFGASSTTGGGPYDAVGLVGGRNTDSDIAVRFNANMASGYSGSGTVSFGGVLVTPNVGAFNTTMTSLTGGLRSSLASSVVIWQNNTQGFLGIGGAFNGKTAGTAYVQAGPGTVYWSNGFPSTYTGATWLNGGVSEMFTDAGLGAVATAALATLNGGTVLAGTSFTMDNSGANQRPFALGPAGGGLAAVTGYTMTVDGVISNVTGSTGPLWIGIPPSTANGNVADLVPGTGTTPLLAAATANPTAVYATGTVNLTGANTFTGGIQFWGGILQVAGISSLGSGGLTFNGGTFQWTATGPDISSRGVTLNSGGATFDANGYTVSLASAIGGSGGLTVASTTAGGTLNLNAAETYTGATTINNGATLGGSGSLGGSVTALSGGTFALTGSVAGSLTLNSGALATLTASATTPQSVGGAATFNGNTTTVIVPGTLVDGISYPILTAAGGVSGTLANVSYSGGLPSQVYSLSYNATQVLLVVAQGQLSATWNGSSGGNWSTGPWADTGGGSVVPNGTGDSAIFGTGGSPVNLNENVTLGTILFDGSISYAINGSDTLTVNDNGHGANITVTAGANSIQPPIILAESTKTVVGSGESLALAGAISGAGYTLTLTGAGTNILNGANSYGPAANTVGTTLSGGGTLQLGNSSALSTGDLSVSASTIQAGAPLTLPNNIDLASGTTYFELNGYNVTLDGTINYNGNLFVEDAGTLTLAGVNTGTGTTTIEGPGVTVSIAADSALGAAPSSLVIDNADLKVTGSPVTLSATRAIAIGSALETSSTASIDAFGASLNVGGAISGSAATANLTVNGNGGSGTVALQGAGTFNGTAMVSAGTLDVANTGALQNSTVLYNTGGGAIEFDGSITAVTFGALSGTQNLSLANTTNGAVTLTVGGNNSSTTYSGNLTDGGVGGAFAFNGTGTMTLTGTSSYKGTTAVDQGILLLTNGGSISCGPTTVSAGAELEITGGALTATGTSELYDTAGSGSTLLIANGSATFASLEGQSANTGGVLIQVNTGGILTASNLFYGRSGYNSGATLPTTGQTNSGLYVDGGTVNVTSNYTMSANSADQSSVTAEIDAGSVTVAGILTIGLNNTGRWSVMDVNGGTLTVNDTNIGISLGATNAGLAALLVRNGMVTANIITMGGPAANAYTAGATAEIYQTNGTLYLGSGGIVQPQTVNVASIIQLGSGTLGATANWSCSIPGQTITLGVNGGDTYTIQAADASNVPHNISLLNQTLTGVGNLVKTGGGTLALNGDTNTWTGTTTVSAGTLALTGDGTNSGVLLDTTPTINIIAPGVLDVTGLLDQTLHLSDPYVGQGSAQALTGNGTVTGSVIVENGGYGGTGAAASLAPAGATPNSFGNFTITGNLTNTSAIILKVDHPPTGAINDEVTALTMTNFADLAESSVVPTLTIVNTNYDLQTGDTFKLFNITGGNYAHIGNNLTITLPTTSPVTSTSYTWDTTQLAVNGTIKLTHGVAPTIPITPTNIVFGLTGRTLTISWPASYKGWSLQSNSINIAVPADWYTVPGSPAVTSENITIPTTGSVYFRLYYQAP